MRNNMMQQMRRFTGCLTFGSFFSGFTARQRGVDGYEETGSGSVHLVDMDRRGSIMGTGLAASGSVSQGAQIFHAVEPRRFKSRRLSAQKEYATRLVAVYIAGFVDLQRKSIWEPFHDCGGL